MAKMMERNTPINIFFQFDLEVHSVKGRVRERDDLGEMIIIMISVYMHIYIDSLFVVLRYMFFYCELHNFGNFFINFFFLFLGRVFFSFLAISRRNFIVLFFRDIVIIFYFCLERTGRE